MAIDLTDTERLSQGGQEFALGPIPIDWIEVRPLPRLSLPSVLDSRPEARFYQQLEAYYNTLL